MRQYGELGQKQTPYKPRHFSSTSTGSLGLCVCPTSPFPLLFVIFKLSFSVFCISYLLSNTIAFFRPFRIAWRFPRALTRKTYPIHLLAVE